jgi:hypothetical protein
MTISIPDIRARENNSLALIWLSLPEGRKPPKKLVFMKVGFYI